MRRASISQLLMLLGLLCTDPAAAYGLAPCTSWAWPGECSGLRGNEGIGPGLRFKACSLRTMPGVTATPRASASTRDELDILQGLPVVRDGLHFPACAQQLATSAQRVAAEYLFANDSEARPDMQAAALSFDGPEAIGSADTQATAAADGPVLSLGQAAALGLALMALIARRRLT